jgi:hypothetical protein
MAAPVSFSRWFNAVWKLCKAGDSRLYGLIESPNFRACFDVPQSQRAIDCLTNWCSEEIPLRLGAPQAPVPATRNYMNPIRTKGDPMNPTRMPGKLNEHFARFN